MRVRSDFLGVGFDPGCVGFVFGGLRVSAWVTVRCCVFGSRVTVSISGSGVGATVVKSEFVLELDPISAVDTLEFEFVTASRVGSGVGVNSNVGSGVGVD